MNASMGDGWPVRAAWGPEDPWDPRNVSPTSGSWESYVRGGGRPSFLFCGVGVQICYPLRGCPRFLGFSAAGAPGKSRGPVMLREREPGRGGRGWRIAGHS